jgi:hypothetical protein
MDEPHPTEVPFRRQLKIDLEELELAFETSDWEIGYYLDMETGDVVMVQENTFRDLENIYSEYDYESDQEEDEEPEPFDLAEILESMDLHDWEREMLLQADQVRNGLGERFERVPAVDSHAGFQEMEDFLETVQNQATRMRLNQALRGKSPFRSFKDTLQSYPQERQAWFAFKKEQTQARALDWLHAINVQVV